jgi:DeoR family transcriptional regulator of aga operon
MICLTSILGRSKVYREEGIMRLRGLRSERTEQILRLLREGGAITIPTICSQLGVSLATARRDLRYLETTGLVRRTRGGAIQPEPLLYKPFLHDSSFQEQLERCAAEKRRIALAAAEYVRDGETIALTAGTTTTEVARCLRSRHGLKVVTNAVNIAMELGRQKQLDVFLTGGQMRGDWFSLAGADAIRMLELVFADVAFIGVNGIAPDRGLTCFNPDEAAVNATMVDRAKRRIVVADHSKLSVVATHRICPVESVHLLITDAAASEDAVAPYLERGIEVQRA